MGIINRGGTVKITRQAIGSETAETEKQTPEPKAAKTNSGVSGKGITVTNSTVNGEYIQHRQY